jgi:hypothetical protein
MNLQSNREFQATREKLRLLEEHYQKRLAEPAQRTYADQLSMQSLKRMINQLTEEIVRFESHAGQHSR